MPKMINFEGKEIKFPATPTLQSLRQPAKYWVISDAQLKRDLKGRTLRDVYRENRAGRDALSGKYQPRFDMPGTYKAHTDGGLFGMRKGSLRDEYLAECTARGHTPHPASIDADHAQNCHREKAPKAERISPARDVLSAVVNRMIDQGHPVISAQEA